MIARFMLPLLLLLTAVVALSSCKQDDKAEASSATTAQKAPAAPTVAPPPKTPSISEEAMLKLVQEGLQQNKTAIERNSHQTRYDILNDEDVVKYNRLLRRFKYDERLSNSYLDGRDTTGMWQQFLNMEKMAEELHKRSMVMYKRPYFRLSKDLQDEVVMKYNDNIRSLGRQ